MSWRRHIPAAVLVAALVLTGVAVVRLATCATARRSTTQAGRVTTPPSPDEQPAATAGETEAAPLPRTVVQIFYPASGADGLLGEPHEIFETAAPGDRAKQIVADLISGPQGEGTLRALPSDTQLRQIYVVRDGVAFVDFSRELQEGLAGGSTTELLTVYAVVDSIVLNVPEITRVGILIEGSPVDTLNGHVDLRRPLTPNRALILTARPDEAPAEAPAEEPPAPPSEDVL